MPEVTIEAMAGPQSEFIRSTARHPAYIGGRGAGKTVASVLKTFSYVQQHPGAYGCITVPVEGDIHRFLLPTVRKFFKPAEGSGWVWQEKKSTIVFPELDAWVFVRSAQDPQNVLGMTLAFFDMQEAGSENQLQTFLNLQGTLRQEGYPAQGWLSTTPNVQRPWLKQIYHDRIFPVTDEPLADPRDYPVYRARTVDNYHLPETMRGKMVADWGESRLAKQELEGEFIAVEGIAFPNLSEQVHMRDAGDTPMKRYLIGWDYGAVRPTAFIVMGQDETGRLWALDEYYKPNAEPEDWIDWLGQQGIREVIADPSLSDKDISALWQTYGIRVRRARFKDFKRRYTAWVQRLAMRADGTGPNMYISPRCVNLWKELSNLAFAKPKGYNDPIDHWVPGSMDHAYDAGSYAIMEFDAPPLGKPRPSFVFEGYKIA